VAGDLLGEFPFPEAISASHPPWLSHHEWSGFMAHISQHLSATAAFEGRMGGVDSLTGYVFA